MLKQITDSKKLTSKKREYIFDELIKLSSLKEPLVFFWVWVVDNNLIDEINIKQANREAMKRSLEELLRKIDNTKINAVLVDWNDNYKFDELWIKPIFIVWWDAKKIEISRASIIAKVFRDKLIDTYSILYPNLWLENHKWYGTQKHISYLEDKSKITSFHRISYKPVKNILEKSQNYFFMFVVDLMLLFQ